MKKIIGLSILFLSMNSFADISCSGSGVTVEINEAKMELTISGSYNGTITNLSGGGEEFMGSTNDGDFKSLTINVDDGEVDIIKSSGRPEGTLDVDCD